jgi:hypothetical protein
MECDTCHIKMRCDHHSAVIIVKRSRKSQTSVPDSTTRYRALTNIESEKESMRKGRRESKRQTGATDMDGSVAKLIIL